MQNPEPLGDGSGFPSLGGAPLAAGVSGDGVTANDQPKTDGWSRAK